MLVILKPLKNNTINNTDDNLKIIRVTDFAKKMTNIKMRKKNPQVSRRNLFIFRK